MTGRGPLCRFRRTTGLQRTFPVHDATGWFALLWTVWRCEQTADADKALRFPQCALRSVLVVQLPAEGAADPHSTVAVR